MTDGGADPESTAPESANGSHGGRRVAGGLRSRVAGGLRSRVAGGLRSRVAGGLRSRVAGGLRSRVAGGLRSRGARARDDVGRMRDGTADAVSALRDGDVAGAREAAGIAHDHAPGTVALVVLFALFGGVVASWLLADLGLRLPALLAGWLGGGYWLYRKPDRRAVAVAGLYAVAALVALVPVAMNVTALAVSGGHGVRAGPFALSVVDVVFLVVFLLLAAVPAGVAWWLRRR